LILTDLKISFTVNLFLPSGTCIDLANDFQTLKALNVAIDTLFRLAVKVISLIQHNKELAVDIFSRATQFSSCCISVLSHSLNISPDTHDVYMDHVTQEAEL
jgi:hypothetical protein